MRPSTRVSLATLLATAGWLSALPGCHPQTPSPKPPTPTSQAASSSRAKAPTATSPSTSLSSASAPQPGATPSPAATATAPGERIIPLGPARPTSIAGEVMVVDSGTAARRPLRLEDRVAAGQRLETGTSAGARVELVFSDGSLVRIDAGSVATLVSDTRQIALHRGRILVAGDRMLGGLSVLTRYAALVPEGTTYVVEVAPEQPVPLRLTVLEGAVWAHPVSLTAPTARPDSQAAAPARPATPDKVAPKAEPAPVEIVLSGERLELESPSRPDAAMPPGRRSPVPLLALLADEPLVKQPGPLPRAVRLRIDEPADQQRRGFLAGRNERLRKEIFWKRPHHVRPVVPLPEVIVRYEYPLTPPR